MSRTSLQFKWIIFQFCGMDEATELGETIRNFAKWCNASTKVISEIKLLTRDFINHKNWFPQKNMTTVTRECSKNWPSSTVSNFNSYIKTAKNKTETSKYSNQFNSREVHEYYSSVNAENNFHWNKLQWPVSAVWHLSLLLKTEVKLYQNCQF